MYQVNGITVKTGDVLLKESAGGLTHNLIRLGQKIGGMSGGNAKIVHAAIYVGSVSFGGVNYQHAIAESVGGGLRIANINPASTYHWRVWHLNSYTELRQLAADFASNIALRNDGGQFGTYSQKNATKSAFFSSNPARRGRGTPNYLERLEQHVPETRSFFCSNFVTLAYSLAAEALGVGAMAVQYGIALNYETVSPAEMEKYFSRNINWTHVGTVNGGGW